MVVALSTSADTTRPRVLFAGHTRYDLPLDPSLGRKWDALAERMSVRVIGEAGRVEGSDERFRLVRSPTGTLHSVGFYGSLWSVVRAEIRSFQPDAVVAQSPYEACALLPGLLGAYRRPKLLVEVHGDWRTAARLYGSRWRRALAPLGDAAAALVLKRADGTRALTRYTADLAAAATGTQPLGCFPTFSDLDVFYDRPTTPLPLRPSVAWVGMLQPYKNPDGFARVWKRVARTIPTATLTMVGDGPMRPVVDDLAATFPGRVAAIPHALPYEVARILDGASLLVLPSRSEGMGRVITESFARGRPVIGTDVGGIPDLVKNGINGLLVPAEDDAALAAALERVLRDPELNRRLAAAASQSAVALRQTPSDYGAAMADMIDRLLRDTQP